MIRAAADDPGNRMPTFHRVTHRADDRRAYAWGYAHQVRPGIRLGFPYRAGPYHNAGPNPTMGGLFDAIGDVVTGIIDVASGGPAKRERAARYAKEAEEAALEAALVQARSAETVARLGIEEEREKGARHMNLILIGGGMALAALTLMMVLKPK
ncbi:MAG: hypothetical protein ACYTG0_12620 [Planctomycetota bacterium]|jgi:hypothetical protein